MRYLFLLVLFVRCQGTGDRQAIEKTIIQTEWKFGEGASLGDWIDFKTGHYTLKTDTIFRGDSAIAIVSQVKYGKLGDDDEMEIILIKNNSKGTYHSK